MRICAIGTTRNEVDLVAINLQHHCAQDIDSFLIRDNGSTDGTQDELSRLSKHLPLEWSQYKGPFLQDRLLSDLAVEAFHRGADWVIPVDADEFWHGTSGTIRGVLEHSAAGALRVEVVNFVQSREVIQTIPNGLSLMTRRPTKPIGPSDQWEELVEAERIAYVEHAYPAKWICRPSAAVRYGWGSHAVSGVCGPEASTDEIRCFHAPLRSYAVLKAKVDADRPVNEVQAYVATVWQLRRWRRLTWEGRLDQEWEANSYRDDMLEVFGRRRPLVIDESLRRLVEPWIRGGL